MDVTETLTQSAAALGVVELLLSALAGLLLGPLVARVLPAARWRGLVVALVVGLAVAGVSVIAAGPAPVWHGVAAACGAAAARWGLPILRRRLGGAE